MYTYKLSTGMSVFSPGPFYICVAGRMSKYRKYCMAGNFFCEVLNFVVDLAVMKFPLTIINDY